MMERMLIKMTAAMAMNKLNENALHEIVGGTYNETAGDSRFLNDIGTGCDRYGAGKGFFIGDVIGEENQQHWNKFGISVNNNWGTKNQYFLNGKETTREEAMRVAAKKQGRDISSLSFTDY